MWVAYVFDYILFILWIYIFDFEIIKIFLCTHVEVLELYFPKDLCRSFRVRYFLSYYLILNGFNFFF